MWLLSFSYFHCKKELNAPILFNNYSYRFFIKWMRLNYNFTRKFRNVSDAQLKLVHVNEETRLSSPLTFRWRSLALAAGS